MSDPLDTWDGKSFVWRYDLPPGTKVRINYETLDRDEFLDYMLKWVDANPEFVVMDRYTSDGIQYYAAPNGIGFLGSELIKVENE